MADAIPEQASTEQVLTALFEKAGVRDAEPVQEEPDEAPTEPDEVEPSSEAGDEDETPEEGSEPEEATGEELLEETEYEGKTYKLPRELKEALLRQRDYTQKTQEVAEKRRATEQLAEQVKFQAEFQQAHFQKAVEVQGLESQLQQYAQVDWADLATSNPAQYLMLDRQQRALQESANKAKAELNQLAQDHGAKAQELRRQAQARCIEEVRKELKDFGPDLLKSIDDTGRSFGFSGEELAQVTDPRVVKVLHAAMQYQKLQSSKALAEKKVQDVRPVLKAKTASSAVINQQSKQLNDYRARLKSTGKAADAEAFLAARFAKSMR